MDKSDVFGVQQRRLVVLDNAEIHSKLLGILKSVDNICKKENIAYMLTQGTLLGAIREKGFIPWDIEDVDIMMHRKDYNVFIAYCKKYPDDLLFFPGRDDDVYGIVPRLKFKQNPEIFAEIFLIDRVPENLIKQYFKYFILILLRGMLSLSSNIPTDNTTVAMKTKYFGMWCLRLLGRLFDRETKQNFYTKASQYFSDKDCSWVFFSNEAMQKMTVKLDKNLLNETLRVPFEDTELLVPKEWDSILKLYYGDSYMVPKRENYKM
ncbi:MAG: LicD family protein [Sedimentibacter sp.]|uniref:LicD family protein n=1 Tax=Sedimentibacter sp. TaxID=1960295 RepID=UPI003158B2F4